MTAPGRSRAARREAPVRTFRPERWLARLVMAGLAAVVAVGCGSRGDLPPEVEAYGLRVETARLQPTLRLFNFPEYLDPALIRLFRETYGVRVVQDFFDTNEAMLARLRAGGGSQFDLVIASDYAVEMMAEAGELEPLDQGLLPNLVHLHPRFVGLPYDREGRYSVPYQWGTTGLGIRGDRVEGRPEAWATWATLFEAGAAPGRFALLDDPRETIGAALLYLGFSVNSTDDGELARAEALLAGARDRAVAFTPASTGRDLLVAGEVDLVHSHSGEIAAARQDRPAVAYLIPREGAVIWADNMVVPAGSPGAYTAHVFMNFILDPEVGARLTNDTRYHSPNQAAWTLLDPELREEVERLQEGDRMDRLEFIEDVGEDRRKFDRLWTRLRAGGGGGAP
jgi:spermidine/putrescine transport system substrate-binding protein